MNLGVFNELSLLVRVKNQLHYCRLPWKVRIPQNVSVLYDFEHSLHLQGLLRNNAASQNQEFAE